MRVRFFAPSERAQRLFGSIGSLGVAVIGLEGVVRSRERQISLEVIGRNSRGLGYHVYSGLLLGYRDIARAMPNETQDQRPRE
jgi:hypothetical protein